jgi:pSer/pThr/pTyr-binding forkhead associated (FHA) protein
MMTTQSINNSQELKVFLIINSLVVPITKEITRLGRGLDNDIAIHEDVISRKHAEIKLEGDHFTIYDKNSTSGTYVNNRRIQHCALHSGDVITLANYNIMFVDNKTRLQSKTNSQTGMLDSSSLVGLEEGRLSDG